MFGTVGVIFCTLGVIFELIFGPWRHLGVTFGALWTHFSRQKTDWGAKGAPRGATPDIPSPFWTPFWSLWGDFLRFEKRLIFWCGSGAPFGSSWEAQWPRSAVNSSKNRGRACCAKVCFLSDFGTIMRQCWGSVGHFLCFEKRSRKRCPSRRKLPSIYKPEGSRTACLACAVFWTRNNNLSKKQQQLLISESISESFSWNGSFLSPFLENCAFFMKSETQKNMSLQKIMIVLLF